jgi:hypothetical protein
MKLLFAVRVIRDLVAKISLFFLPIFLFNLGYHQLSEATGFFFTPFQLGIITLAGYYFIARVVVLLLSMPLAKVMQKMGIAHTFAFGHLFTILAFALLMFTTQYPWLIWLAALAEGFQIVLFWTPYHVLLARNTSKSHVGQDLGLQQFLLQLVSVLAPAFAGAGIFYLGYSFIFLVATAGVLLSMIFALQISNQYFEVGASWTEMKLWLQERSFRKLALSYAGRYINDATLAVWPLYVFLALGAVEKVGYLYTVSLFIAMVFSLFIGSYIDHHRQKRWFFASGGVLSLLWLVRSVVTTLWTIAVVDVIDKLTTNFYALFFDAQFLKRGKGKRDISYFTYREVILSLGAVIFWLLFIGIFMVTQSWLLLFILAATGVLMSLLVSDKLSTEDEL